MPIATLRFTLPEEQSDYEAARLGREALATIWNIDEACRSLLKYGDPSEEARDLAVAVRAMISVELLNS